MMRSFIIPYVITVLVVGMKWTIFVGVIDNDIENIVSLGYGSTVDVVKEYPKSSRHRLSNVV